MKNKLILLLKVICIGYIVCAALTVIFGDKEYELKRYTLQRISQYTLMKLMIHLKILFLQKRILLE